MKTENEEYIVLDDNWLMESDPDYFVDPSMPQSEIDAQTERLFRRHGIDIDKLLVKYAHLLHPVAPVPRRSRLVTVPPASPEKA